MSALSERALFFGAGLVFGVLVGIPGFRILRTAGARGAPSDA